MFLPPEFGERGTIPDLKSRALGACEARIWRSLLCKISSWRVGNVVTTIYLTRWIGKQYDTRTLDRVEAIRFLPPPMSSQNNAIHPKSLLTLRA